MNFDVDDGGGGSSGKSMLTAVASTPANSTLTDGKKSPWDQSDIQLGTFRRQSIEMMDDDIVASKV